ncbi:hypothetical protein [Aureimonas endophytica]|uniref:hypothetical protein n=1 Tax=Aureimonas endophytica TaxID=2027858 RepID=UPI001665E009|nr:hypothetical protein [Aureimonas endophytica]
MQRIPRKKPSPEEIVAKLRQVDVLLPQGRPVAEAVCTIGVTNEVKIHPTASGRRLSLPLKPDGAESGQSSSNGKTCKFGHYCSAWPGWEEIEKVSTPFADAIATRFDLVSGDPSSSPKYRARDPGNTP